MKEFNNLAELRKSKGLTSTYVAKQLGITRNSYYKKENLLSPVTVTEGICLSSLFGVGVDQIKELTKQK